MAIAVPVLAIIKIILEYKFSVQFEDVFECDEKSLPKTEKKIKNNINK